MGVYRVPSHKVDGGAKIAGAQAGTRYKFIVHETHCGCLAVGGVVLRLQMQKVRSPCGSADLCASPVWPEGHSVAVGLDQVLRVGEFVELIDVGLGNHDVDGREHEWTPCGIVLSVHSLLDEAEDDPAGLVRGVRQRGLRRRDPACQTRKAPDELGSFVRRLWLQFIPPKTLNQPCGR